MINEKRQQQIKEWFNNPYNALLVLIITLAFALRLFFYIKTQGQTLWWDEAEYMSAAKKWAFGVPYELNPQRPPLFQALSALFFLAGLGEGAIKFFLVVIPSVALVTTIFYLGKEMYNERVGIIAAIFAAVSWTFLFWSARTQPDFLSMTAQVLSILYMWKYWKNSKSKNIIISGFFAALGFYFKISALLVPMIFIVFILVKDRLSAIKNKDYYYFSASFLATLVPYFIWSQLSFGNPLAFRKGYVDAVTDFPIAWYNLKFYSFLTDNLMFILFILGVIVAMRFALYLDLLAKDKKKCFDPEIYGLITLSFISAFYIFYQRNTDDRWVFLWMPFIFFFAAQTILRIYDSTSKKNMYVGLTIAIILIGACSYLQVNHASSLIDAKKDSYSQVKEAALWMKENSVKDDGVFSVSYTQTVYYTERNVSTYSLVPQLANSTEFDKMVIADKPKFIMWSMYESHPTYIGTWINDHLTKGDVTVVYAQFADSQNKQPSLLVFQPDYSRFK
ncbi:MAG TPA: glycosyltransferase family 39 protein [Candidatus Nanoarchaeia archaeon]|nr:glycosyltransferase family 39 protein [Candidatus Nanoarchaeia archaeon]